ncbi:MAG: hypothetical protein HPY59_19315 [Anaerolineae bacterium]|jgi:pilus assembly protein CpaF|nr:hypothetical protein [Anaerolineae bacterium]
MTNFLNVIPLELSFKAIREQVVSSIVLNIHMEQMKDVMRRVVQVSEVRGMASDTIVMQDIFVFHQIRFQNWIVHGGLIPTGLRPKFLEKLAANSIENANNTFELSRI